MRKGRGKNKGRGKEMDGRGVIKKRRSRKEVGGKGIFEGGQRKWMGYGGLREKGN